MILEEWDVICEVMEICWAICSKVKAADRWMIEASKIRWLSAAFSNERKINRRLISRFVGTRVVWWRMQNLANVSLPNEMSEWREKRKIETQHDHFSPYLFSQKKNNRHKYVDMDTGGEHMVMTQTQFCQFAFIEVFILDEQCKYRTPSTEEMEMKRVSSWILHFSLSFVHSNHMYRKIRQTCISCTLMFIWMNERKKRFCVCFK